MKNKGKKQRKAKKRKSWRKKYKVYSTVRGKRKKKMPGKTGVLCAKNNVSYCWPRSMPGEKRSRQLRSHGAGCTQRPAPRGWSKLGLRSGKVPPKRRCSTINKVDLYDFLQFVLGLSEAVDGVLVLYLFVLHPRSFQYDWQQAGGNRIGKKSCFRGHDGDAAALQRAVLLYFAEIIIRDSSRGRP